MDWRRDIDGEFAAAERNRPLFLNINDELSDDDAEYARQIRKYKDALERLFPIPTQGARKPREAAWECCVGARHLSSANRWFWVARVMVMIMMVLASTLAVGRSVQAWYDRGHTGRAPARKDIS